MNQAQGQTAPPLHNTHQDTSTSQQTTLNSQQVLLNPQQNPLNHQQTFPNPPQNPQNPRQHPQTPRSMKSGQRAGGANGPPPGGGMLQELQRGFYEEGLEEVAVDLGLIKAEPGSGRKRPPAKRPIVHYMGSPQNAPPGSIPMFPPGPDALYPPFPPQAYSSPVKQDGRLPLPSRGVRAPAIQPPRLSFREMVQREQQEESAPGRARRGGSRGGDKASKGLRHFSMKVCEKVEEKGRTTYNEVADELVREIAEAGAMSSPQEQAGLQNYDEKNIRRRVYDALNVLMAMDIIIKDKKEIHWKGLPSAAVADIGMLKEERLRVEEQLAKKQRYLGSLHQQLGSYENLVVRNQRLHGQVSEGPGEGIAFPFVLIKTKPQATVEVEISEDMQLVHFDFNDTPYKMLDHDAILELMGLVNRSPEDLAASGGAAAPLTGPPPETDAEAANGTAVPHLESGPSSPRALQPGQTGLSVQTPPPSPYQPVRQEAPQPNGVKKGGRGNSRAGGKRLLPEGAAAPPNGR